LLFKLALLRETADRSSASRQFPSQFLGAAHVANTKGYAVVIAKIKLCNVAVQMLLAAMLINAFHAAFEDRILPSTVFVYTSPRMYFIGLVTDAFMACKMVAKREIAAPFVGNHRGFFRDIGFHNWNKFSRANAINMEFLVPLFVIDEAVDRIKDGTITGYTYDPNTASLRRRNETIEQAARG
jgi:hypothetical protein